MILVPLNVRCNFHLDDTDSHLQDVFTARFWICKWNLCIFEVRVKRIIPKRGNTSTINEDRVIEEMIKDLKEGLLRLSKSCTADKLNCSRLWLMDGFYLSRQGLLWEEQLLMCSESSSRPWVEHSDVLSNLRIYFWLAPHLYVEVRLVIWGGHSIGSYVTQTGTQSHFAPVWLWRWPLLVYFYSSGKTHEAGALIICNAHTERGTV